VISYDYAVFIGRFSPFHLGHLRVIEKALTVSDYVIVVVGSANRPRNTRVPFTFAERRDIILASLPEVDRGRVIVTSCNDYRYNDTRWIAGVQHAVSEAIAQHSNVAVFTNNTFKDFNHKVALAGMYKDGTSYYLNSFPQWDNSIAVRPEEVDEQILSSTNIRKKVFAGEVGYDHEMVLAGRLLMEDMITHDRSEFDRLFADWAYEQKYEAVYGKGPHVTVDACVVQAGHVLLIERGREYGRGLLALPGGFLNRREKVTDGVIRELREETRLKVPEKVLRGSITKREVYDDPYRSNRSHIITHAHLFELSNVGELPKVVGSDDAAKAHWYPISLVQNMEHYFFEDHWDVIADLLGF
jgi:bifunctional NMN adenylyltransferase/nudix hydrolase